MASSLNSAWQEWMTTLLAGFSMAGASEGGVSRQTLAATLPPDRYYCLLDELPLHLIPQRDRQKLNRCHDRSQPLFLNPACKLCPAGQLPDELLSQDDLLTRFDLNAFASQGTIAWVRDATSGNLLPFWLGPALESVLHDLGPNEPLSPSVPDRARCLLEAADILLPQRQDKLRRREREKEIRKAGALFQRKGYAPFSRWIHPFHIAALRRYYRYLIRTGKVQLGDGQSPRRYVAYNEPVARFFHCHIAATLSSIAGEPLKPSYVYLASYLSGAELKKHTDREQCEFSVTLCLDFSPEPALETPWPIRLDTPSATVAVYQALGDGLAYRGTRLPHYRDVLRGGRTSTSIFFHYVAADFPGSLE